MMTQNSQKLAQLFCCKKCDYNTSKRNDFMKHLMTLKHKNDDHDDQNDDPKVAKAYENKQKKYVCECGKEYKYKQGLSVHKKKCNNQNENIKHPNETLNEEPISKELIIQLIKQNQNLQDMLYEQHNKMYELAKEGKYITNNNNTTNNNHFNLNVFLNEKCKDAINLMDFVDSLKVKLKDLEYTARSGYAEGVSQIFINALSELNVHKRPIHCSDFKREVLYIKDQDLWEKEDEDKTKITNAIKIIGNKNIQQISEWKKANPEYNDPTSKQNDNYMKMICNAMSGSTKEEAGKNYEKIIKNIAKEVIIDKSN